MYRQGKRYIPLSCFSNIRSSVISQKDEFQNGYFKKTKHATFSEKKTFLTTCIMYVCVSGGEKWSFSENLAACVVFLKHLVWDSSFCLITDEFFFCLFDYYDDFDTLWLSTKTLLYTFWQNMVISCVNPKLLTLTWHPHSRKM